MTSKLASDGYKAWPFQEASRLLDRYPSGAKPEKGYFLFETGYGPSGLPHIGTFGEVVRTTMVRRALAELSSIPSRLVAFSDDLDGLRKLPENIPNKDSIAAHLGKPLTKIPDPFGTHESFGHHNNARLRSFLDEFGFDYEFKSATQCYESGEFDATLLTVLNHYDQIMSVILPTLGKERQATYSPFLPICPETQQVLQVPVLEINTNAGTIIYEREDKKRVETRVTGGDCKLQWKVDWAMRWSALEVDYEMAGKDLTDSVRVSSQICKTLGTRPPESFIYELFLDENGEKISKSRGNGISIDQWLTYASPESLSLFMFKAPRKAKRLYFDVIPKAVSEYCDHLDRYNNSDEGTKRYDNAVWHIHAGTPPRVDLPVSFNMLLNLASVCNTENPEVLWGFISRYSPGVSRSNQPLLSRLVEYALVYYKDFIKPIKQFRQPLDNERLALENLRIELEKLNKDSEGEKIQSVVYEVGKKFGFKNLRDWFKAQYEVLFGQSEGPRIGSFIALYGIDNFVSLIDAALSNELPPGD